MTAPLAREAEAREVRPIETAPKDRTPVLLFLKDPLPEPERTDLGAWHGVVFVGRHNGVEPDGFDIGWQFAAPVGQGGFPDRWMAGWLPIPTSDQPATVTESLTVQAREVLIGVAGPQCYYRTDDAIAAMLAFAQTQRAAIIEACAGRLDGYAGGHYMAKSCAAELRSMIGGGDESRTTEVDR